MKDPLNILMITHHRRYRTSGRSQVIGRHLVARGHKVTLMVTADERKFGTVESEWDGVRVIEAPDLLWGKLRSGWDPWALLNRTAYLRREKPDYDLVHCFETRPTTIHPALYYARRHDLPLLSDWNDWWRDGIIDVLRPWWYPSVFGEYETYYEEAFRPACDGTTAISTALTRRAEGLGIPAERLYYLPGGTTPGIHLNRAKEECRSRFGLPLEDPILGFASADSFLDMELVLTALPIVIRRFPSAKLILTGEVRASTLTLARKNGILDHIVCTGYVPNEDLPWWLGCADIFLLPFPNTVYNVGRWPNKVGLYMSLERPVVANPYGDIKALIEDHQVGLAADVTAEDFAAKIIFLLENPAVACQLGRNGRKMAETTYNWETLVCGLEDFYYRILNMEKVSLGPRKKSR
ncbi:MAG: glycosyltransferase family 4 protein [Chloroflexota bacterium]